MLRLLEHYASPQGEGPRVGVMSQFVRFAGCNLKCPGWPCDTQHAIDPKLYRKDQEFVAPLDLIDRIVVMAAHTGAMNVVFTGGEPLLQNQDELAFVARHLEHSLDFEIFSNGTLKFEEALAEKCNFVMDWKLPGSGEDPFDKQRITNLQRLNHSKHSVKFVITTRQDLMVANELWSEHLAGTNIQTFVGAAWDKFSNEQIVNYVKAHRLPWRLNVQVHNYIFGAQRRYT